MTPSADDPIPAHLEHRFRLSDGRTYAMAEWGDPDGLPVLMIHGTPGGRINWWEDPDIYRRHHMRRFTLDRPGYGASTRKPGRTVADLVPDVAEAFDQLGIRRFAVQGRSGGGPHALALATLLPDRVIRCLAAVSVAPFDAAGLDWLAGQTEGNVIEARAAIAGEEASRRLLEPQALDTVERLRADRADWMGDGYDLSEPDVEAEKKHLPRMKAQLLDALAHGPDGWIDDNLAFVRPWGFDVADIRVPVVLEYGRTDVLVPPAHGDWLAARIPGAVAWVDDEAGHFGNDDDVERAHAWLAAPDPLG